METWKEVWAGDIQPGDIVQTHWTADGDRVVNATRVGARICLEFQPQVATYYDWDKPVRVRTRIERPPLAILDENGVRQAFEVAVQAADAHAVNWLKRHPRDPERYAFDRIETQFQAFRAVFGRATVPPGAVA